ncbi:diguanylate cyclase [Parasphingorhabdus sp. JC815]|uniref:GGDEF domain-containing protein n=1 Tax=Parasphingorhabdus sp. JC815 TaxID=3232140 RepID=UPI003457FBCB
MATQTHFQVDRPVKDTFNIGRWFLESFNRRKPDPEPEPLYNDKLIEISNFLQSVQLEPTPEAYKLAWEYKYGASFQLCLAVDEMIERHGCIPTSLVKQLTKTYLIGGDSSQLSELITNGKRALRTGHKIISDNRSDNRHYSRALEQEVESFDQLEGNQSQLRTLISLTNAIVEKSEEAERQLKDAETQIAEMRNKLDDATQKAETDQLTGLPNRWAFEDHLKDALLRSQEAFEPLTVAFIDIDNFKLINDNHGHEVGDRILKRVAKCLDSMSDSKCHLARHGGEEFVVLFLDKNAHEVFEIIDNVRAELCEHNFMNRETNKAIGTVSFSAGIASLAGDRDPRIMLRRADSALYLAKRNGRNQVVIHEDEFVH